MTESNESWSVDEIKRVAGASGKPLEVRCAQAFDSIGWTARLGTYFDDRTLKPLRELDVLAFREEVFPGVGTRKTHCSIRALVSCKGFPPNQSPLTYSAAAVPSYEPCILSSHRPYDTDWPTTAAVRDVEDRGAQRLLADLGIGSSSPIVAFSIMSRIPATNKNPDEYKLLGDRELFDGVDSALKAAIHWRQQEFHSVGDFYAINVPICVFHIPFWDVCIDDGIIGEPTIKEMGFQILSIPNSGDAMMGLSIHPLVIIAAEKRMNDVVFAFDSLWHWFSDFVRNRNQLPR